MAENENLLAGMDPRIEEQNRQQKARASYDVWIKGVEKREQKVRLFLEASLPPGSLIRAAMRTVEAKKRAWQNALDAKNEAIKDCIVNHAVLSANYWQEEYKAYEKYIAAQRIYAAILEVEKAST